MALIKTSELKGKTLDYAVAVCEGYTADVENPQDVWLETDGISVKPLDIFNPSTDWSQGGPIIERESISLYQWGAGIETKASSRSKIATVGRTPLIAAMRCYVASVEGDVIEIPSELLE